MEKSLSAPFFSTTRVSTCRAVVSRNGQMVALSFPNKKNKVRESKAPEMTISNSAYQLKPSCHVGMPKKPLTAYTPHSYRSRLPTADLLMPYKNASSIEIGDRGVYNPRSTFRSTYMANMKQYNLHDFSSNQGVISSRVKWQHKRLHD